MCVTHRHLNCLVSHKFRHCTNIDTCHYESTSKTVSQRIPREVLYVGVLNSFIKPVLVSLECEDSRTV